MLTLNKSELTDLIVGAAFLGSGGGGSLYLSLDFLKQLPETFSIELTDVQEVEDKQWGCAVAAIGAPPSSSNESSSPSSNRSSLGVHNTIPWLSQLSDQAASQANPLEFLSKLVGLLEQHLRLGSEHCSFILPMETGAANTLLALLAASIKKIPLVDGCGAGRSVPQLNMTTYALTKMPTDPTALISVTQQQKKNTDLDNSQEDNKVQIVFNVKSPIVLDKLIRSISTVEELQNSGLIAATFTMTGETLRTKKPIIPGTLKRAQGLGKTLREAKEMKTDPVQAVLSFLNEASYCSDKNCAFKLFRGEVASLDKESKPGFDVGTVTLEDGDSTVKVFYKNENLIAWQSSRPQPLTMGPDLICYLTPNGDPCTNADIKKGDEVVLIGVKASQELRDVSITQIFLDLADYEGEYVPIEILNCIRNR